MIIDFKDAMKIGENVRYGDSYDICIICKNRLVRQGKMTEPKAEQTLSGSLTGKKVVDIAMQHNKHIVICPDCIKKQHDLIFGSDISSSTAAESVEDMDTIAVNTLTLKEDSKRK